MHDLKGVYDKCLADGFIIKLQGDINKEKVRKMLLLIESNKEIAEKSAKDADEKVRKNRNGINYYGQLISYKDFKEIELQLNLYATTLKKEIEKKLIISKESDKEEKSNN